MSISAWIEIVLIEKLNRTWLPCLLERKGSDMTDLTWIRGGRNIRAATVSPARFGN